MTDYPKIPRGLFVEAVKSATDIPELIEAAEHQKLYAVSTFFNKECGCVVGAALIRTGKVSPDATANVSVYKDYPYYYFPGVDICVAVDAACQNANINLRNAGSAMIIDD
jgi:hypothetical protein